MGFGAYFGGAEVFEADPGFGGSFRPVADPGRAAPYGTALVSDRPDNLILVYLRRIDQKVDGLREDMSEVKERLGHLEGQYSSMPRPVGRLGDRLDRIERRLDIAPAA